MSKKTKPANHSPNSTDPAPGETTRRLSEEKYRALVENTNDVHFSTDAQGYFTYISPAIERFAHYQEAEVIGQPFARFVHPDDLPGLGASFERTLTGNLEVFEFRVFAQDGAVLHVRTSSRPLWEGGQLVGLTGVMVDITERKQAEEALQKAHAELERRVEERTSDLAQANRMLKMLSECNQSVVRADDEQALLQTICQIIVDLGGYVMAWIGYAEQDAARTVRPVAQTGIEIGYLSAIHITWADDERGRGPTGTAIRSGRPCIARDIQNHPQFAWKEDAIQRGYASSIALPLHGDGRVIGALNIYASVTDAFDTDEVHLLIELAGDLAFGIMTLRERGRRKQAEEALQKAHEDLIRTLRLNEALLLAIPTPVFFKDREGRYLGCNRAFSELMGVTSEQLVGKTVYELWPSEHAQVYHQKDLDLMENPARQIYEYKVRDKDGLERPVIYSKDVFRDENDQVAGIVGAFMDITERKRTEEQLHRLAELQSAILNNAAYVVISTDSEGVITSFNPASERILGYTAEDCIGKLTPAVFHDFGEVAERARIFSAELGTTIEPGLDVIIEKARRNLPNEYEWTLIRKDGRRFPALLSVTALRDPHGAIIGFLGIASDITERKQSFEEIRRHLQRLNALRAIDMALTSSFDLQFNLSVVLEQVLIQLAVDAADVLLLNPYTLTLEYAAKRGFRTRAAETIHIRLGESFAGRVALERRAVRLDGPDQIQESPQFAALWAGEGFTAYYAVPLIAKGQIKGVLEVFHRTPLTVERDWINFLETLAGQAAIGIENAQLFDHLQRSNVDLALAYDATIEGWARALDLRDKETEGHTQRVTVLTERLARVMGISEAEIVHIRRGALLHDIGKMGVPDSILLKPDKLTDEEWVHMRQHPQYAFDMLAPIAFLRPALDIPYCHHEKWDGTGYPRGLKGEQIPLAARLFAVVDVWDALHSDRHYREIWSEEQVLKHIQAGSGTHFDPKVVELFLRVVSEMTRESR